MAPVSLRHPALRTLWQTRSVAALTASLMLGACGQTLNGDLASINSPANVAQRATRPAPQPAAPAAVADAGTAPDYEELKKATEYWGNMFAKNPRDLEPALNYARNLKAMGEKRRALSVLQQVALFHGESRELAGEYGRLALELDQVKVAKQLLAMADDAVKPDWRIVSARGAALAKEGNYNEAIPFFERALGLAHDQPSVMSNLALAYAMNGEPGKAESMLRQAASIDANSPRIRQNLALVLGLQGKYDEAKLVAARDIPMNNASDNADYIRQVVKLDPRSVPSSEMPVGWSAEAKVAEAPLAAAVPVEKVADVKPMPPIDAGAAHDTDWVTSEAPVISAVTGPEPMVPVASAKPAPTSKVLSVAEMAAQFAVGDEQAGPAAKRKATAMAAKQAATPDKPAAWLPQVAQVKR